MDFGEGPEQEAPVYSPWGAIDHRRRLGKGVWSVGTSSHGGVWLSEDQRKRVPMALKRNNWLSTSGEWWEEDGDAPVILLHLGLVEDQHENFSKSVAVSAPPEVCEQLGIKVSERNWHNGDGRRSPLKGTTPQTRRRSR